MTHLRSRSDFALIEVINSEIDFHLGTLAELTGSNRRPAVAMANAFYIEAATLLPLIFDRGALELQQVEAKLDRLRESLANLSYPREDDDIHVRD